MRDMSCAAAGGCVSRKEGVRTGVRILGASTRRRSCLVGQRELDGDAGDLVGCALRLTRLLLHVHPVVHDRLELHDIVHELWLSHRRWDGVLLDDRRRMERSELDLGSEELLLSARVQLLGIPIVLLALHVEAEAHAEEKLELKLVDLNRRQPSHLSPVLVAVVEVVKELGCRHHRDEEEPLEVGGREADPGVPLLHPLEVDEAYGEAAGTRSAVLGDPVHKRRGREWRPATGEGG
mmetsp:Transcript_18659/g.42703  ORF Transcript_18659/g.42703 Transcript_18659/m.42703 type:complete len:236 (+) Transcript_18659:228-935(+)